MRTAELVVHRRITRDFINADAVDLVFNRATVTSDNRGGRLRPLATALPAPQRVRIIPARSRSSSLTYMLPSGTEVSTKDSLLIGMPELDVALKDWFEWMGTAQQVVFIASDRTFQTLCQLSTMGESGRTEL